MKENKLAVFSRFKTGQKGITGEAKRQRNIINALSKSKGNPADRTRTGIAQLMAKTEGTVWKNIYSGIFRDFDEILLPMHIVKEEGRLPLKRGPKALQEVGVPYYKLTREGILVAVALASDAEQRTELLKEFFSETSTTTSTATSTATTTATTTTTTPTPTPATEEHKKERFADVLVMLSETCPLFVANIVQLYVSAFCEEKIKSLLPFDLMQLYTIRDESFLIQKELVVAFMTFSKQKRSDVIDMLNEMINGDKDKPL